MTDDHLHARVQRIEADVHALYRMTSMRDGKLIRGKIAETVGDDARACIILRGVQRGLSGPEVANALADRGLPQATKQRVSDTLKELDEAGFVTKSEKGHYTAAGGLHGLGLDRTINATIKRKNVDDIPDRVADVQEMVWKLEAKYGPVAEEVVDQVAVSHRLAEISVPTAAAVQRAFEEAGVKRPPHRYAAELASLMARHVKRRGLEDLILDFRQHALAKLSRRFGGKTKGREDELRDYLLTYFVPRGYAEAHAAKGRTDILIPSVPAIIECKVWDDIAYHEAGIEQLSRYIHTEKPKEAYMVVFGDRDPLPSIVDSHEQAVADRPTLSGLVAPVIVVAFEVDYPSDALAVAKRRAKK